MADEYEQRAREIVRAYQQRASQHLGTDLDGPDIAVEIVAALRDATQRGREEERERSSRLVAVVCEARDLLDKMDRESLEAFGPSRDDLLDSIRSVEDMLPATEVSDD